MERMESSPMLCKKAGKITQVPHLVSLTRNRAVQPTSRIGPKLDRTPASGLGANAIARATWLLIVGLSSQGSNLQPFGPQLAGRSCDFPQADFWPRITS